jgi:hypothetical protein
MTDVALMVSDANVSESANQNCVSMGLQIPMLHEIAVMLDEAGIDYIPLPDEKRLYVTALAFNIWIRVHSESGGVSLYTNWHVDDAGDELEILRHVNQLNLGFPLVQFAWDDERDCLHGHAWLSARSGLSRAALVRTAIRFADIFKEALDMTCTAGFIEEECLLATIN